MTTEEKKIANITFDKSASGYMISIFKDKFPLTCIACGKEVNKKNLGGIVEKGFIHNNIVCLIQMQEKDAPPETRREWAEDSTEVELARKLYADIYDRKIQFTFSGFFGQIKPILSSIESSALSQGEKIGAEKMVEKIKKSEFATMANQMIPEVMKVFYEELDALKG